MVMQKIIEVCICTIDLKPCKMDKLCIKCKKYKEYEDKTNSKRYDDIYEWRFR